MFSLSRKTHYHPSHVPMLRVPSHLLVISHPSKSSPSWGRDGALVSGDEPAVLHRWPPQGRRRQLGLWASAPGGCCLPALDWIHDYSPASCWTSEMMLSRPPDILTLDVDLRLVTECRPRRFNVRSREVAPFYIASRTPLLLSSPSVSFLQRPIREDDIAPALA